MCYMVCAETGRRGRNLSLSLLSRVGLGQLGGSRYTWLAGKEGLAMLMTPFSRLSGFGCKHNGGDFALPVSNAACLHIVSESVMIV